MEDWLKKANMRIDKMPEQHKELRELMLTDLWTFAQVMNPGRVYGDIHKEVYRWLQSDEEGNQLLLLPRAHMKSHCIAVWCAWYVTRHPETSILYISATAELAEKQLYDIKNIFLSDNYRLYFPDMFNPEEGKREKWSVSKIATDHPIRRKESIRDWTIATAGLTTNTTGWHADVVVGDDVVVPDNAYTEDGRGKVKAAMSQMTSIRNAGGFTKCCGTRYHPADIYATWKKQVTETYDEETGDKLEEKLIWDIKEHVVESANEFLWPRKVRPDGKAFGFSLNILARIRGEYEDKVQYYAQYYNNPNDPGSNRIERDRFQYFDERYLERDGRHWLFQEKRLNVYAAIDFAFSLSKRADSTAIVVIGIDEDGNIYILDIDRFKTDKINEYFKRIVKLQSKWGFKTLRAEVTVAQKIIVEDLKDRMKREGLRVSIDEHRPSRHEGTKGERIAAALEWRYDDMLMWHKADGFTPLLEEELVLARPPHDDVKDALAAAVEIAVKPMSLRKKTSKFKTVKSNSRFGGVAF